MKQLWLGIYKLTEECGEVIQIAGKLGPFPEGDHPDGKGPLKQRLEDELADLEAAIRYVKAQNNLDAGRMGERTNIKLSQFLQWGLTGIPSRG